MSKKPETTVTVTFEAPESLVKKLEEEAREHDRSRSAAIRQLLLRALASQEKIA